MDFIDQVQHAESGSIDSALAQIKMHCATRRNYVVAWVLNGQVHLKLFRDRRLSDCLAELEDSGIAALPHLRGFYNDDGKFVMVGSDSSLEEVLKRNRSMLHS